METHERKHVDLGRPQMAALLVGGLGLLIYFAVALFVPGMLKEMLQSYLWAWVFWGGVAFGCFAVALLHHTLRSAWGTSVMRLYEAGGGPVALITIGVLFLPIVVTWFVGNGILYRWSSPEIVANDHILLHRKNLLNPVMATLLTVVVFGLWSAWSSLMRRSTLAEDRTLNERESFRRSSWGAAGIVMFVLTATVVFTVWVMSLDAHWSSTMYAPWFIVGQALAALALGTAVVCGFSRDLPYSEIVSPKLTRDLGNLLLAFTMFFAYTSFSQYLIIWSGNIPEYTSYYKTRADGGWIFIGVAMVFFEFLIPFLLLLNPVNKRKARNLMWIGIYIFAIRIIDSYWVVLPAFPERRTPMPLVWDLFAFAAIGLFWLGIAASQLRKAPLLPVYDQRLKEAALSHH